MITKKEKGKASTDRLIRGGGKGRERKKGSLLYFLTGGGRTHACIAVWPARKEKGGRRIPRISSLFHPVTLKLPRKKGIGHVYPGASRRAGIARKGKKEKKRGKRGGLQRRDLSKEADKEGKKLEAPAPHRCPEAGAKRRGKKEDKKEIALPAVRSATDRSPWKEGKKLGRIRLLADHLSQKKKKRQGPIATWHRLSRKEKIKGAAAFRCKERKKGKKEKRGGGEKGKGEKEEET